MRAIALCLAAALLGCHTTGDGASQPAGTETVTLEVGHRSAWRELWIEGATDLPDGAIVTYGVTHEVGETTPAEDWPAPNLITTGRATVKDGQYWARINTIGWPRGPVRVVAQFPLSPQPPPVEARYGAFGEHLTGPNIISLQGLNAVEVEHHFEHRP